MIRGKKMRKPLRKLKIQEKAEMEQELTPDFIDENEELTLLSSVNIIVTLAEDSGLSAMFFERQTVLFPTFQNVRVSQRSRLCFWLFSSSRVQQATNPTSQMLLVTLIVTAYKYYSTKER